MFEGEGGIVQLGAIQATTVEAIGQVGIVRAITATGMAECWTESV